MREALMSRAYAQELRGLTERASRGVFATTTLLVGPPLIGKTEILEKVGRTLLCRERRACGVCRSCLNQLTTHPDVFMDDDSSTRSREHLAVLLRRIHERPLLAPSIVVFLWHLDRYTPEALSLLLKSIEDVSGTVFFLMTADILELVPKTLQSRSAVEEIPLLSQEKLAEVLLGLGVPQEECVVLARLSGGRPGLAGRFLQAPDLYARYRTWWNALNDLPTKSYAERARLAQTCASKEDAGELLTLYQSLLRDRLNERHESRSVAALLRRSREALAMVRANLPPALALEFLFFTPVAL